jgi:UDP-N-acetylmuramoyl-tripeptide--D-alanyl-D-alanine ligase
MKLSLDEVAAATGGRVVWPATGQSCQSCPSGSRYAVRGTVTDSRAVQAGQLFVPVVGDRDGHEFIPAAVSAGAAAYLTAEGARPGVAVPAVEVEDTLAALADLGRAARGRLGPRVLGITGSVGKTSVKDLVASVLATRWTTTAAVRSFNNEIGVPLTLLNAPEGTEATVVEMGARGIGHVASLCDIAGPTVGIVTLVGAAHLELFGSLDEVARGKGELVESLPKSGWAVLNADDARVAAMAGRTDAQVVTFGARGDVRADAITIDGDLRPRFRLASPWGEIEVALGVRGAHMVANALAASAAGLALGLTPPEVAEGLAVATLSPWRMEVVPTASGATLINDAYNANPVSMRAALEALVAVPGAGRRVAVLGLMAELGAHGADAHREMAALAGELGLEVIAVGTEAYGVVPVADVTEAAARVGELSGGDAVLIKASRVAGLERLAELLAGRVH